MVLKLEGALTTADAKLLAEICDDVRQELGYAITIDMSGVNFLGNQGAQILHQLKTTPGLTIEGAHLFVQQQLESIEDGKNNE
jgi:anti-anti-sigma regulatory factor